MIPLLLAGCTDPVGDADTGGGPEVHYTDQWTATAEACGWTAYVPAWTDTVIAPGQVTYPSEECVDRVLADFKTDVAAFQAADDLPDPYGDVRGDTSYMGTQLHYFLSGARGFFQFSFGELDELAPSDLISSAFIADMRDVSGQTGQTAMNAVLYNYTTSVIDVTVPTDSESTYHFQASTNTLQVPRSAAMTVDGPPIIVHEVRHNWGRHTLRCDGVQCDPDITGAWGYHLSAFLLEWRHIDFADDPGGTNDTREAIESYMKTSCMRFGIATFQGEPGTLLPEWEAADLSDY